jgi:hypothetical protein
MLLLRSSCICGLAAAMLLLAAAAAATAAGSCRKNLSGKYPGNFCMKIPI